MRHRTTIALFAGALLVLGLVLATTGGGPTDGELHGRTSPKHDSTGPAASPHGLAVAPGQRQRPLPPVTLAGARPAGTPAGAEGARAPRRPDAHGPAAPPRHGAGHGSHGGPKKAVGPTGGPRSVHDHAEGGGVPSHVSRLVGLEELINDSDRIVVGKVIGKTARWNSDRSAIFTLVTVQVDRTLKGKKREMAVIRIIGGEIPAEQVAMNATHQPKFEIGQRGVVFITDDPTRWTSVAWGEQGYMQFQDGQGAGQTVLDGFGRPVLGLKGDALVTGDNDDHQRLQPEDLVAKIAELAR